ncbi:flagellar basal body P-ring formation chaperone FlgA [Zoogloea sp.]|uniref:flagellar basal body P-ring formation chaperone FlgA n=1 Tax=Zoogloea sp. TaxID=49181 RepID=UPI002625D943|nr:flagellar basal body P-ring formation chaperone FlgA [Zoogloea sp.]MDD3352777.1 flagellar basal body P-ring formation chaperone FlgA [Zoogloea sp.]
MKAFALLLLVTLQISPGHALARQDPLPIKAEVARFLEIQARSLPGEASIQVGEFSPANALIPCVQLEAFFAPGARAWGRVTVGVRCLAPATWSVWVPAEVKVRGNYLVTTHALTAGHVLGPGDVRLEQGELTSQAGDILTDPGQVVGHAARVSLPGGRPLAASHLRLPPAVIQGQAVKVLTRGPGFQVANDGMALTTASDGQTARVRLANGQVLTGIARNGGHVEVRMP